MEDDWIMVRLLRSTREELERVRRSMKLGEEMGVSRLDRPDGTRVSLDAIIRRLIAFRDGHAARTRRSKANARARRKAAAAAARGG